MRLILDLYCFHGWKYKQQLTSYKLTIWYQFYHHWIMRDIQWHILSAINMCLSLRSCPKQWLIYYILSLHCLHMISIFANCEIQLDGKNPHLTKLHISEWSTFDCGMKRSRIEPKEILTRWWSNMYSSETAFQWAHICDNKLTSNCCNCLPLHNVPGTRKHPAPIDK